MNSSFLGLRTCIYKVPNLAAAKVWYSQAFKTKPYFDESYYVGFNIGGYELGLLPQEGDTSSGTNIRTYWGVEDMESSHKHLIELGASAHEAPMDVGEGVLVATVKDPWDNLIGLIYNPFFKIED